ncbi:MAG: hypothetical protein ACYCVB_01785 [Bacilli bacterium]
MTPTGTDHRFFGIDIHGLTATNNREENSPAAIFRDRLRCRRASDVCGGSDRADEAVNGVGIWEFQRLLEEGACA